MRSLDRRDFLRGTLAAATWAALPSLVACAPRIRPTAFHYDDLYLTHDTGEDHPERPARLTAVTTNGAIAWTWLFTSVMPGCRV